MISCKEYVEIQKKELEEKVKGFKRKPKLVVVQVDHDKASDSYVRGKERDSAEIGIIFEHIEIDSGKYSHEDLVMKLIEINADENVDGIIVQLPIPDKYDVEELQKCISSDKDVDGFRVDSRFKSCTPLGVINWLKYNNYNFSGKVACVIGRSNILGKPLADMLTDLDATVILCHSKTPEEQLGELIIDSDIIFTCINKIEYFKHDIFCSWNDIIDIGLGIGKDNKLHGNIDAESVEKLKEKNHGCIIVSGKGNTGLTTRLALMQNVVEAYEMHVCE